MFRKLEKMTQLSLFEWKLLLQVLVLIPVVTLSLYVFGYRRSLSFMNYLLPAGTNEKLPAHDETEKVSAISRMVKITANHAPYPANCLKQSLILWWLLARSGIRAEIIFGVQENKGEEFSMHAWVEYNGYDLLNKSREHSNYIALT